MGNLSRVLMCPRKLDVAEAGVSADGSRDSGDDTFDSGVTRVGSPELWIARRR
jgi:hypothetical protein